ncbi:hypothetical protein FMEXI_4985 [Fusarium mexicanum]|uniref:Uncharacterized protein n=1 Tax=Fusarium mexicanum TaxID=751941 RepID=A0A8H5J494_9HYPO|nr:hypothetical protein FMEXI_4985 [Fusarium mexicanum]
MQRIPTPPAFGLASQHLHLTSQDSSCHLSHRVSQAIEKTTSHILLPHNNGAIRTELQLQPAADITMASNRDPFLGDPVSPYRQDAKDITDAIESLIKEREQGREERTRAHLADVEARLTAANKQVADLKESLKASEHRASQAEALAAREKRLADFRIAQFKITFRSGARRMFGLAQLFEGLGKDPATTNAHAVNESAGSAADVNSSVNTREQSAQLEELFSPSSSDTSDSTRFKREESPLFIDLDQPSDGSGMNDIASIPSDGEDNGETVPLLEAPVFQYLRVDEIDMMRDDAAVSRLWEAADGHKRRRTE